MIALVTFLILSLLQALAGFGMITLFRIRLKLVQLIAISFLLGVGLFSLIPFLLQLCYIPLTAFNIAVALLLLTFLLNLQFAKGIITLRATTRNFRLQLKTYDIVLLLLIIGIAAISVWRCYYFPPTPRDLTSGAEAIAEYAVKEKSMINSVFSVNFESTNNPFKPPFITSLQIIYKHAGFPFGQVWLSVIFISFLAFLYSTLCTSLHRIIAGILVLAFLAIPEMYAYSFLVLFDYSNAVYFCLSLYFLFIFMRNQQVSYLLFSSILMSLATYIRSETLILAIGMIPVIVFHHVQHRRSNKKLVFSCIFFPLPSVIAYLVSVTIYIRYYLPVNYAVENLLRKDLWNPMPFLRRFWEMNDLVIFSNDGVNYYGYFFFIFIAVLLVDAIWKEAWNPYSLNWLYGVLVIYAGLPFIAHLFPLFDLHHSTKRGLFKIFPLMLLYMGNSQFLRYVSGKISAWEQK